MPIAVHRRRDISDSIREKTEPHLPGREGSRGAELATTGVLSMRSSGLCARALRGGICPRPWRLERHPGHDPRKRGFNTKSHLAADAHGMPVRAFVTQDATADCTRAIAPIDGFAAERLLADRGRDTDEILARAEKQGMEAVIPPKKSRWHPSARLSSFR